MSDTLEATVAGAGRTRALLRWPAGFATLVVVFATAGSAPTWARPHDDAALYARCQRTAQEIADEYRNAEKATCHRRTAPPTAR